jgi:hypothetical protein
MFMGETEDLEGGFLPSSDKTPDFETAEEQGNLMGDDEDPDYSGNDEPIDNDELPVQQLPPLVEP